MTNYTTAATWGTKIYGGDGNWWARAGLKFEYYYPSGGATPTTADTKVTARALYWIDTQVNTLEGSNSPTYSGDFPAGANPASFAEASGARQVSAGAWADFPLAYGSAASKSQAWSVNISLLGEKRASVSAAFTVPARPYAAPAASTSGAAALPTLSGSTWSSSLSWTNNGTSTAPVQQVKVYRWDNTRTDLSYLTVATLGAVASYVDSGLAADRKYGWAVQAVNSGGASAWHYFGSRHTAPATPMGHLAARFGANIAGTFTTQSTVNPAYEVWDSTDGGSTWSKTLDIAAAERAPGTVVSYTLASPDPALPHLLRVKATIGGQSSGWATIGSPVVIISKPNPPTPSPSGGAVDAAAGVTLTATPASTVLPDGSAVTGQAVKYRIDGGAWVESGQGAATSLALDITPGNGHVVEHAWQVKGAHADWSEWSAVASFKTSGAPVATITGPSPGTITTDTLTITAGGADPEGLPLAAARYGLQTPGGVSLAATYETTTALGGYTYPVTLTDGQQVVAWVQYLDADGLWGAKASAAYTVAFLGPAEPVVTATWSDTEPTLTLSFVNPSVEGLPPAAGMVVRVVGDEGRTAVASVAPDGSITYRQAPLVETIYEVVTRSDLPSATVTLVTVPADPEWGCRVVLSGGPDYSRHASLAYNVDIDRTAGRSRVLVGPYVGYAYPDEVVTESLTDSRTVSGTIFAEDAADFATVQTAPDPLWYRDPLGASWPCSVQWPRLSISDHLWPQQVSFTVQRIGAGPLLT